MTSEELMQTPEAQVIRTANLRYIAKVMRGRDAKQGNWPGVPLSHFGILGIEPAVMRAMIDDGSVKVVERPRKTDPNRMVRFICLP